MRRGSFGGSYGVGRNAAGGGGGSGSGGFLRTVRRAVKRAGPQESVKSTPKTKPTSPKNQTLSLSSHVSSSSSSAPISYLSHTDFDEWEYVDSFEDVLSSNELQHAIFSLQQVVHQIPPSRLTNLDQMSFTISKDASMSSDSDWNEPSMLIYNQRFPASCGFDRVYDVLNLLQTEPSVQRMVVSLSSDKAVWEAVLNNEAVREIRESYNNVRPNPWISDEDSDCANINPNVLEWMFDKMKAKLLEVIGAISQSFGDMLKPLDQEKPEESDTFSEKLKSAFLLTVVVLLIVVVARGDKA